MPTFKNENELPLRFRLRYAAHEIRDGLRARRSLGTVYVLRVAYLAGSFVFGYRVRCFGNLTDERQRAIKADQRTRCRNRADWDPVVGAYCELCMGEFDRERKLRIQVTR